MAERPEALRVRRPQLRREEHPLNSDGESCLGAESPRTPPPSEASSYTFGRQLLVTG